MRVDPTTSSGHPSGDAPDDHDHGHRHLGLALVLISTVQLMVVLDALGREHRPATDPGRPGDQRRQPDLGRHVVRDRLRRPAAARRPDGRPLGRRQVFIGGVLVFALASLLGGLAQTEWQLLSARALQGAGAAAASPTALALITTTFPAGPQRNRAFAVYAAMSGAGAAVGLILGGALTEVSWRWTMLINVPIGLLVAFLAPRFLARVRPQPGRWDLPGRRRPRPSGWSPSSTASTTRRRPTRHRPAPASWTDLWTLGPIVARGRCCWSRSS